MLPTELGRGTDSAQELLDNLTFELDAELSLFSHDNILSDVSGWDPV